MNGMIFKLLLILIVGLLFFNFGNIAEKNFTPPGMVRITEHFFVDEKELTNSDYRAYLQALNTQFGKKSQEYQNALPDTMVWDQIDSFTGKSYGSTYFRHPSFGTYPVIGVSQMQAEAYCHWRSKQVMKMLRNNETKSTTAKVKSLNYRLPSASEWNFVARLNGDRSAKLRLKKKDKGRIPYNLAYKSDATKAPFPSKTVPVAPSYSYLPGKIGVYNLHGNVAEMISEEGKALGGA